MTDQVLISRIKRFLCERGMHRKVKKGKVEKVCAESLASRYFGSCTYDVYEIEYISLRISDTELKE